MQKRRITALLLATVVAASTLFAGCGESEKVENNKEKESIFKESGEKVEDSKEEVEELEPVTLKYWMGQAKSEDSDLVEDAINKYLEDVLPNTTVEIEWVAGSEWKDKWSKAMSAQEKIDLTWMGYLNQVETEVSMGSLMPIDDLVAEYGAGIVDALGEKVVDLHRSMDGNLYFLPAWQGLVGNRYAILMPHESVELCEDGWAGSFQASLYETDELPYFNVDDKKETISYVEQYLAASKEAGKLGFGYYIKPIDAVGIILKSGSKLLSGEILVSQKGDTYYLEADSSLTGSKYNEFAILHDWYKKGYIREDVASVEVGDFQFRKDTPLSESYLTRVINAPLDTAEESESGYAGYPIDAFYVQETGEYIKGFSTGAAIPATSENPERAMMFLNLLYTDAELYNLFVYGIEDIHYTKNSDGTITIPEGVTYTGPYNWMVGTCMNSLQTEPSLLNYYQELKEAEDKAKLGMLDGFTFDAEPVSVEISNINAIKQEYTMCFVNDNWEDLFAERRDKLIAAGIDTVLEEYEKQLTVYAEEKGMKVEVIGY